MRRKTVYAVILILVMLLAGCSKGITIEKEPELLESCDADINTATVAKRDIYAMDVYQAEVIYQTQELSFSEDGNLAKVYVEAGEKVKKGKVLAKLQGSSEAKAQEYQAKAAQLTGSYMQKIGILQNDIAIAQLSGEDTDEMELELKHENELFSLESSQVENKLKALEKKSKKAPVLKAPFDGEVIAVEKVNNGSYISQDTSFIAIARTDKLQVTCDYISESDIKTKQSCYAIINGQKYDLKYKAYTQEEISERQAKDTALVSRFNLPEADSSVQAGDYAVVCAINDSRKNVLTVPVGAIYTQASQKYVLKVVDGIRVKTPIDTGLTDSINTEVLSGLEEGETVYVKE